MTDFEFCHHGSIGLLLPISEAASEWVDEHIDEHAMTWGPGIVIEPRYVPDILDGIVADGLTVEG